jgi:hypothetical protein
MAAPKTSLETYPLLELAKEAVHGHAMIAERVREHADRQAARLAAMRQDRADQLAAEQPAAPAGT